MKSSSLPAGVRVVGLGAVALALSACGAINSLIGKAPSVPGSNGATSSQAAAEESAPRGRSASSNSEAITLGGWLHNSSNYLQVLEWGRDGKTGGRLKYEGERRTRPLDAEGIPAEISGIKYHLEEDAKRSEPLYLEAEAACPQWIKDKQVIEERTAAKVCELVTKRKDYWLRYVNASLKAAVLIPAKKLDGTIEHIAETGEVFATDMNYYSQVKLSIPEVDAISGATGVPVPADVTAVVEQNRKRFLEAISNAAGQNRISPKSIGSNPQFVSALQTRWRADDVKLNVVRLGMFESGWNVQKNSLGYPTERKQLLGVVAKHPAEKFCRVYDVSIAQDHEGGGVYGKLQFYNEGFSSFLVTKCP
jgi:hypothetical protein